MGVDIKRNREGLYKAKSTISDESLTGDGWMTEDEFKKVLIQRAYFKFVEDVIKIDLEFPSGYRVNDKYQCIDEKHVAGSTFIVQNWNKEDAIENKYREICERLKIEL
jgi:hypothetical protein